MIKVKMLATISYMGSFFLRGNEYEITDEMFTMFQGKCVVVNKTIVAEGKEPVKKVIKVKKTTAMKGDEVTTKEN